MDLESGDQARCPPSGPGQVVSLRAAEPAFGATTKMSVLLVRSGSGSWLLTKAIHAPSGDHSASSSVHIFGCGQLFGLFGGQIVEVERIPGVVAQVALDVLLEVVAVNHDGLGRHGGLALFGIRLGLGWSVSSSSFESGDQL
jgi:hypothetical protein